MASTGTRYQVSGKGAPLTAVTYDVPTQLEPTEVLIRIKATAINPADFKMVDQGHRVATWPLVPGLDGAGIVEAVGSEVRSLVPGDRVLAQFVPAGPRGGSYQTHAVVQEKSVAKMPSSWSFENAASLPVCFCTALIGLGIGLKTSLPFLKDSAKLGFEPSSVLVLGGSSAVGASAIQLLRLALPKCKILATSSLKHHKHLTETLGVDAAIDRSSSSIVDDVRLASPGHQGVDVILDAVGAGATQREIFESLSSEGPRRYAQVWTGDEEIDVPAGVESVLFRGRDLPQLQGGQNMMGALQGLLEQDKYSPPLPVHNLGDGFEGLKKGLELMRNGVSGEKLVVRM